MAFFGSFQILPKAQQQAFVARICILSGLYPVQLLPADRVLRKIYCIYSRALIALFFACLISFYIELYRQLSAETIVVEDIMKSVSIITLFLMTVLRQGIIRFTPDVRDMLGFAEDVEVRIHEKNDSAVQKLFARAGRFSNSYYIYYAVGTAFLCLGLILEPLLANKEFSENGAVLIRKFPLPFWFPFDMQLYYWESFFLMIFLIFLLVAFQVSVDFMFFYFIRSPVIQLEILHHFFKHFAEYSSKLCVSEGNSENSNIMMRKCIEMHRDVIKFVDIFNKNFSNIMVLDFVQSSFRIASIVGVIRMTESVTVASFVFTLIFLWITLLREYYIYYSGNEIMFLSSQLVFSVYETDWHKENRHFQFMVQMFMVRSGKPLQIKIGPFGNLGMPALLSIIRASFSYLSLATGIQQSQATI